MKNPRTQKTADKAVAELVDIIGESALNIVHINRTYPQDDRLTTWARNVVHNALHLSAILKGEAGYDTDETGRNSITSTGG